MRSAEGDTNSGARLRGVNLVYPDSPPPPPPINLVFLVRSKGIQLRNDAHWLTQLQKDTTLFRGHLFNMASNNLSVNIISDEELAQKR